MVRRFGLPLLCLTTLALLLSSCGMRPEGWGVVLWSGNETAYPTGALLPVYAVSTINNTYTIDKTSGQAKLDVPQWRISYFSRKNQAEAFEKSYLPYVDKYAVVTLDGLPLREEPSQDSKRVYKLRVNQKVKILSREAQKVTISGTEGYWYKVLTGDGVAGYAFDQYLDLKTPGELAQTAQVKAQDPFLTKFLNSNFRPVLFRTMIDTHRIDLTRFSPDFGIFPDPKQKQIVIKALDHTTVINYTSITKVKAYNYSFDGTSLVMIEKTPNEVNLQYSDGSNQYSEDYAYLDVDMTLEIIQEEQRRMGLYQDLYSKGDQLSSDVYGTVTLQPDGSFTWKGFGRLVPEIVPQQAPDTGDIHFNLFLSDDLRGKYDGAVTFSFHKPITPSTETGSGVGGSAAAPVDQKYPSAAFLYTSQPDGIRLRYVAPSLIKDHTVTGEASAPVIIFFKFGETPPAPPTQ